nr:hypothetical protein [Saliphagus sp. LR7]
MSEKKYIIDLSTEDRHTLEWFISTDEHKTEDNRWSRILLKTEDVLTDSEIKEYIGCHPKTVFNTRKATLSEDSRRFIAANPTETIHQNSMAAVKPTSSLLRVQSHRKAEIVGRMHSSLTALLLLRESSSTRFSNKHTTAAKKRPEAIPF